VGRLFVAGIIPGIILALMLMGAVTVSARRMRLPRDPWLGWRNLATKAWEAVWGLLLTALVLGGIYLGAFTPTEAAATSAVYAFIIAVFVYRDLKLRDVVPVLLQSARVIVMLMFIISNAGLFAYVLTSQQIPQALTQALAGGHMPQWLFLLSINFAMLIAGNFIEPTSIVLIFAPILYPLATALAINPVHLGVLMTVNMEIGLVHPPVGLNLFVAAGVTRQSLWDVTKAALPWLLVLVLFLLLITFVPILSTWLPDLAFGKDPFVNDP
jgi:C4-dicarboxylate transporter DctM subunit